MARRLLSHIGHALPFVDDAVVSAAARLGLGTFVAGRVEAARAESSSARIDVTFEGEAWTSRSPGGTRSSWPRRNAQAGRQPGAAIAARARSETVPPRRYSRRAPAHAIRFRARRHNDRVVNDDQALDDDQWRRIASLTVAERLRLLDRLCRDLTRIAAHAQRVG